MAKGPNHKAPRSKPSPLDLTLTVAQVEELYGLDPGSLACPDGNSAPPDMLLSDLREQFERMYGGPPIRISAGMRKLAKSMFIRAEIKRMLASQPT